MAVHISSGGGRGRGRAGRRGRGGRRAPMAEINVTPFVDVMLVLLIIFMVTAPLLVSGVPVNLPDSRAEPLEQKTDPLEIAVDRAGAVFVDGDAVPAAAMGAIFGEIAAAQDAADPRQIILRADKDISYGRIMAVMGELNRAGLNSVSLATNSAAAGSAAAPARDRPVTAGSSGAR